MSARRGVLIFLGLLTVLGGAVLLSALLVRRASTVIPSAAVLVFNVPPELDESEAPSSGYTMDIFRHDAPTTWQIVHGIRQAAHDDGVEAMVLHIDGVDWGWATVAEVRDALLEFRNAGKALYASFTGGGEREYLLATAAPMVGAPPLAILQLDGLTASALFLRGTFDKLGVTPNFAHVGQYKSGVEGFTHTEMSPAVREALEALLDDEYQLLLDSLGVARGISADSVGRLIDEGPYGAEEAYALGLIDTVLYEVDMDSLAAVVGRARRNAVPFTRYLGQLPGSGRGPRIALVLASGSIASGHSRETPGEGRVLGSETLIKALRQARSRNSVKAVVLRIDSPGGSAQASDEIWREVKRCRSAKPVIVSMSDVAASGGYYIAAAADSIVAHPGTITGSIGIYGGKLNILGLYHKLGLSVETVTRGRHAGMLSPYRDFTGEEALRFQTQLESAYETFLSRVAEGRDMAPAAVDAVGQGRVWSGLDALEHGLVDELGGIDRAFDLARSRAGIPDEAPIMVDVYPKVERTLLDRVLEGLFSDEGGDEALAALRLPPAVRAWIAAARFPAGAALALMPYTIEIR